MNPTSDGLRRLIFSLPFVLATATMAGAGGKVPVPATTQPPAAKDDGWEFQLKPYGWLTGLDGTLSAGDLSTDVDISPTEVISHLNWAVFLQAEARRGRWGLMFDGFYAELSGGGTPPHGLYSETNFTQSQAMVELALAYRVLEGQSGFVDIFAGARYINLEVDLQAAISDSGVRQFSQRASQRVVESIASRADAAIDSRRGEITSATAGKVPGIKKQIIDAIVSRINPTLPRTGRDIAPRDARARAGAALIAATPDVRAAVSGVVDARVAGVRSGISGQVDAKLAAAEKKLAKVIERDLRDRLPQSADGGMDWIDPFAGVRGQWNMTEKLFLAGRADIGAFGIDSFVTWQIAASLGWQINESWSTEIGYRIMEQEHTEGEVTYDMNTNGFFIALGYNF